MPQHCPIQGQPDGVSWSIGNNVLHLVSVRSGCCVCMFASSISRLCLGLYLVLCCYCPPLLFHSSHRTLPYGFTNSLPLYRIFCLEALFFPGSCGVYFPYADKAWLHCCLLQNLLASFLLLLVCLFLNLLSYVSLCHRAFSSQ